MERSERKDASRLTETEVRSGKKRCDSRLELDRREASPKGRQWRSVPEKKEKARDERIAHKPTLKCIRVSFYI